MKEAVSNSLVDEMCSVASECLKIAKKISCDLFEKSYRVDIKADKSVVTEADKQIEIEQRKLIQSRFPTHFILGEEFGGNSDELFQSQDLTWVLDPIDGTFSFFHKIPFYSSLLAIFHRGEPIIGFASLPQLDIVMHAAQGRGAFINGERVKKTHSPHQGKECLLATADLYRFRDQGLESVFRNLDENYFCRTYSDALGYYLLLKGGVQAFVEPKAEIWDVAPFYVIMREAGHTMHQWNGKSVPAKGCHVALALDEKGNPYVGAPLLQILKNSGV